MRTIRIVSSSRARKLRKKNVHVWWSVQFDSLVWEMEFKFLNRWKYDRSTRCIK